MKLFWKYLRPYKRLVLLSMLLAGVAQALTFLDPVVFGWILDRYALHPGGRNEEELVRGVLGLLALAIGVALAARLARSFQEYVLRLLVQRFGQSVFDDGLKQTLRLSFEEYEEQRSGEALSILQKTRRDTESFLTAAVNLLFSTLVGV
ncbi:MAG: ABC transporter ATP-binding protein, partial [Chitinophagaceae bacterium]